MFADPPVVDYANGAPGGGAALAFYLQQGANMGGMAVRLASLGRPPGSRYLEVGCGFGIGLDFARRSLGWDVTGLDPSPFAAAGREQLGLPIEPRYLRQDDRPATGFDVVHASEVLEHVGNPLAMLQTLRHALCSGGTLVLTTPAAEMIRPDTSLGLLIPLLSAGWHMVIQSEKSLTMLLLRAGFDTVRVTREGAQLVAIAGDPPHHMPASRGPYLAWLAAACDAVPAGSDLGIGLRARLYRERCAAGDTRSAAAAWDDLDTAVSGRFGRGVEGFEPSPDPLSLDALVAREPVCLAGVLLSRGLECLQRGEPAERTLMAAISAANRLRAALGDIGSDDGDAENVALVATMELTVIAALRGDDGIADRIDAMIGAGGRHQAEIAARRCFVNLVNRGALEEARRLDAVLRPGGGSIPRIGRISHDEASILYCRAVMELQLPGGRRRDALEWLGELHAALMVSAEPDPGALREATARTVGANPDRPGDVAHVVSREIIIIDALIGADGIADRIEALVAAGGRDHAEVAARQCFVALVNRGDILEARRIDAAMPPEWCAINGTGVTDHAEASLIYCRAMMELQLPDGRSREALGWLEALRAALVRSAAAGDAGSATILYWPILEAQLLGLHLIGNGDQADGLIARAHAEAAGIAGLPPRPAQ